MDRKQLGQRVKIARKSRGMTGERLAEACNIHPTYLRQIESGTKTPSLPMFVTICRELQVSPNFLLPELVEGTEAEKIKNIEKIFLEGGPTPSQIETIEEMIRVIMKER
jgi:transcriptional regulator with XRE-family HTH domain